MDLYSLIRPLLFRVEAERAHGLAIAALKCRLPFPPPALPRRLHIRVAGLDFPSPLGMAAGFDKNAEVADALLGLGFGFVETGTVTPLPQPGNPHPRLFRLVEDHAVINRLGFNSRGQETALRHLRARVGKPGIVGVNIGANKDSPDRIADYARGAEALAPFASYLTANISSPNTPGLRALQERAPLEDLLSRVLAARGGHRVPVFLKVAPDLAPADVENIAAVAMALKIDAIIIGNTTIGRPPQLRSALAGEAGGLSGAPLKPLAMEMLGRFYRATGGTVPLVGAGGIGSAEDAYRRIRAGASLVQLYSALVYEGPGLARRINTGLAALLERDGFNTVADAVGVDAR